MFDFIDKITKKGKVILKCLMEEKEDGNLF